MMLIALENGVNCMELK